MTPVVILLEKLGCSNYPSTPDTVTRELEKVLAEWWSKGYSYAGSFERYVGESKRYYLIFNPISPPKPSPKKPPTE